MKRNLFAYLQLCFVCFFSSEGFTQQLSLQLEGENNRATQILDSIAIQPTFVNYKTLQEAAENTANTLQQAGYLNSELTEISKKNDSLYLATYQVGKKYIYIKVYFEAGQFDKKELENLASEVTDTYFKIPISDLENSLEKLNAFQTSYGDPFASLQLTSISEENDTTLTAQIKTTERATRTIDSIVVRGYDKFPRSFLKYYAGIKKGRPFLRDQLLEKNTVLNNLGFASSKKPPEVLFNENKTTVYYYLEKQNFNAFDGILGFATNETTQKLELNGYLNLQLNNNLNFGEELLINYKADGNEQRNFEVRTSLPYLLKTPVGLEAGLQIFKRDSTFVTTQLFSQLNYQTSPTSKIYAGYKSYESSNLLDETNAGSAVEDFTSAFLLLGGQYVIRQNDALFPIKSNIEVGSEIGKRSLAISEDNQLRLQASLSHIFNLNDKNSIFLRSSTSFLSSDMYVVNELYRFGGIRNIRGFNENSIDASLYTILATEYRFELNPSLYTHSVIDIGYFENEITDLKNTIYSFGLGFGLKTPAGLISFLFANGNIEGQDFNFSNTKIHLQLNTRF